MNRPSLTITNEKESDFAFDVSIQGVPAHEATVRFVIEGDSYDTTINCQHNDLSDKWVARIPNMRLDESAKNFRVEVIAGGYFFCPSQGALKIISSPRVTMAEMVQRPDDKQIKVSASMMPVQTERKTLLMVESMTPTARKSLAKHCEAAGKIFARAASAVSLPEQRLTSSALVDIMEAVKKAIKMIEVKVYFEIK